MRKQIIVLLIRNYIHFLFMETRIFEFLKVFGDSSAETGFYFYKHKGVTNTWNFSFGPD